MRRRPPKIIHRVSQQRDFAKGVLYYAEAVEKRCPCYAAENSVKYIPQQPAFTDTIFSNDNGKEISAIII
ncbi:hypothetical protein PTKU46_58770 [Paraburkholderia terrae]